MARKSGDVKPATMTVWAQVKKNLEDFMPQGIRLDEVTTGPAKDFYAKLKAKRMASA
jgi:hypothetical protein